MNSNIEAAAAAALIAELSQADPHLEWPLDARSWSLDDIHAFFDSCGMWTPQLQAAQVGQQAEQAAAPEPCPVHRYAGGPMHCLIHGDARPPRNPDASIRLFCFLWTGGMAQYFERLLCPLFSPGPIELVAINLPGRERAARLPLPTDWDSLVSLLADALTQSTGHEKSWVEAMPYAFYGHS